MSYRLLKYLLGETNLEWKCYVLFGSCFFVLITASFWFYGRQTEQGIVWEQNRSAAQFVLKEDLQARHWKSMETDESRPLAGKLSAGFSKQPYQAAVRFILPKPPKRTDADHKGFSPRDQFERNALQRFLGSPPPKPSDPPEYEERRSADGNVYHYYQPIRAIGSECYSGCHRPMTDFTGGVEMPIGVIGNSFAGADGDVMALAEVSLPIESIRHSINKNRAIFITTAIVTFFLAMVASYAIVRYVIVKPLRHLRDVSDAISRGNTTLRAEIHTGDEFDELAVAFNRMLGHLTTAQEELRGANATLDGKVDELAQANMRLYELNMLKSDFLATMSHELRTPLNSILGFSEVLGSIDALDDKQKRYVQNIQKSGRTLLEMINDVLDLAKIESGKMEPRPTDFLVAQLVAAQCDMARPLTERKNIDLENRADPELPPIHQDQSRVHQILNNLLSNAIKFTPEGGRIAVSARRDERDFLVLQVADTGVGISPEEQTAIFEKFRQGRTAMPGGDAMTREHTGSGLGLSIVKELCRLLGGEVSVQSELGKGSTFTVRLPWILNEEPRLDSGLVADLEGFTKQRFDVRKETAAAAP